jgi:hypothetical protein
VNEPGPTAERRMWMITLNRANGELALDRDFRDADSIRPGLAFDRTDWPHGAIGPRYRTAPCLVGKTPSLNTSTRLTRSKDDTYSLGTTATAQRRNENNVIGRSR